MNTEDIPVRYIKHAELTLLQDKLLQAETLGALAITQAKLGTWHRNLTTGHLEVSERLREIFGFTLEEQLSFEGIISRIHTDYRPLVLSLIEQAIVTDDDHDIEYPLSVPGKRDTVWVRATGKVISMHSGGEKFFIGTVMDVTAQRNLAQRKQNFLQSLSYELKTPLIALDAYIQVLERKLEPQEDPVNATMLHKMQAQVEKINAALEALKAHTCKD
jgi:PAS domain S-box-containing protein